MSTNLTCKFANGGSRCVTHCGDPVCGPVPAQRESDLQIAASLAGLQYNKLEVNHIRPGVELRVQVWAPNYNEAMRWHDWLEERYAQWGGGVAVRVSCKGTHNTLDFHRGF